MESSLEKYSIAEFTVDEGMANSIREKTYKMLLSHSTSLIAIQAILYTYPAHELLEILCDNALDNSSVDIS